MLYTCTKSPANAIHLQEVTSECYTPAPSHKRMLSTCTKSPANVIHLHEVTSDCYAPAWSHQRMLYTCTKSPANAYIGRNTSPAFTSKSLTLSSRRTTHNVFWGFRKNEGKKTETELTASVLKWDQNTSDSTRQNPDFKESHFSSHHHHYHLFLNREGRWDTSDDFTTSFLHFSLFSIALWDLANSRPGHSLTLSSHLFLCLPRLLPPFIVPCKMVFKPQTLQIKERKTRTDFSFFAGWTGSYQLETIHFFLCFSNVCGSRQTTFLQNIPFVLFRSNPTPALLAEWPGSFTCNCGNTGVGGGGRGEGTNTE